MPGSPRCLYNSDIAAFLTTNRNEVFGMLCDRYHGDVPTTQLEAWTGEIDILQKALLPWKESNGRIVFEYDIPRLGNYYLSCWRRSGDKYWRSRNYRVDQIIKREIHSLESVHLTSVN